MVEIGMTTVPEAKEWIRETEMEDLGGGNRVILELKFMRQAIGNAATIREHVRKKKVSLIRDVRAWLDEIEKDPEFQHYF